MKKALFIVLLSVLADGKPAAAKSGHTAAHPPEQKTTTQRERSKNQTHQRSAKGHAKRITF